MRSIRRVAPVLLALLIYPLNGGITAGEATKGFQSEPRAADADEYGGFYQCRFEQAVSVNDQGKLSNDSWFAQEFAKLHNNFLFDADTGEFKSQGITTKWTIIQAGSSAWDLTAHVAKAEPIDNIMRIQVWNKPIKFMMTNNIDVFSGICEHLK